MKWSGVAASAAVLAAVAAGCGSSNSSPAQCVPNQTCQPTNACAAAGTTTCPTSTGAAVCVATGNKADGTSCGTNQACTVGVCVSTTTVNLTGAGASALQILPQAASVLAANPATAAAANLGDMTTFQVDLIDPIKFLLSFGAEASSRLGSSPATPVNPGTNKADYVITNITQPALAAPSLTPGLVVNVLDTATPKRQTTTTSTGVIALSPPGTFPAGNSLTADAPAFIIPDAFADLLAPLALGAGKTHVDLGAAGYILVFVIDRVAGAPVAGATVAPVAAHTVTHINAGPAGLVAGTATDALGLVLITGPATGTSPITISASSPTLPVCPDPVTSTNCLVPASAGLSPNLAFVAPIVKH